MDVRPAEEFALATLPGALNVPLTRLRERRKSFDETRPTVFVSYGGREGYLAARIAKQRGLPRVGYLSGGLEAWVAGGRALVAAPRGKKS